MFINEKRNSKNDINANIRYSQTSLNSTQNSDLDYNLYCFSQGYENKEKGFWRGVLRNKNIDLDLKLDKDWNRKIEFEDELNLSETQSQISNVETDIISIMNEAEIGWDKNLFQNFKKKQAGIKKPKNKEWLISNGLKRGQQNTTVELRTQNYKQFEENEKNKRLKKNDKALQYKQELILDTKKYGTNDYNLIKSYAGSDTKKTGSSTYNTYGQSDSKIYTRNISNINTNKNQRSPRIESQNNYGIKRQEIRIGQNYNTNVQKKLDDQYIQAFTVDDRPKNLVRLEVSIERKSKNKYERKPESRKHERIHSSKKKRKVSLDKYGKPLTNTSRVNIDTSTKKKPKDRIENRSRLEVSVGKKEKKEGRKPSSRQHKRYSSEKKKRISVDSQGRPLTNTSRLNVDTSTKKKPKDRIENRSRLEVSVGKKEKKEGRKPSSRKHRKYSSEKKKRISVDSQGRPLTNTSRVNIDTSTKKQPKERLENRARLEVSVGKKEKISKVITKQVTTLPSNISKLNQDNKYTQSQYKRVQPINKSYLTDKKEKIIEQKPYVRKFDIGIKEDISKNKRIQQTSYNQYMNRKNQLGNYETKVVEKAYNLGRLEVSAEKKNKEKYERKPESRKHERITSSKKKRKVSLDKYGKPLTNTSRVNIDTSKKKEKKERLDNISRLEISEERKSKNKYERKPESRKHERIHSSKKKRKVSLDKYGKPLTNTSRVNIDTSTKKKPKDRIENRSRLEVSVGKKEKKEGRKPSSRQHRKYSSEKKKRISVDSQGRPLANTSRVNIDTSTKKKPKDRLENRSRLEVSVGKKEKKEGRKPSSRRHSKISSEKKKRISLDSQGKPLTNVNRLRVGYEKGQVKYAQLEDFDKYEDKSHQRHQVFQTESNKYNKQYNQPSTKHTQMKTPIKSNLPQKTIQTQIQHRRQLTGQISSQKISEAGNAFFCNKYKYERIKKEDAQSNKATYKTQQSKGKESSYTNMRYGVSTSKLNTAETNASEKRPRFDKGIDISKTSLFDNKKEQTQINRNYSYNKDLINSNKKTNTSANTNTNNNNINKRRTSETKTLDFSKYYKKYKEEKPKPKQTTTYQKPIDNINGNEIYEYVPISSSKKNYTNNSTYSNSSKVHKKNQKEFSIDLTKYNGVFNKNYPQTIEVSEETQTSENKRNRSSAANQRFSFSQNAMAYFKLQFVTTKQVVDKFWKSIDNGELSIAMFNNQRNMSKLSNYVSPAKNKMTKINNLNENINRKINFTNNEINGKMRQSYKV